MPLAICKVILQVWDRTQLIVCLTGNFLSIEKSFEHQGIIPDIKAFLHWPFGAWNGSLTVPGYGNMILLFASAWLFSVMLRTQSLGTISRLHVPGDCDSHVERTEDQVLWPWEPWRAKETMWYWTVPPRACLKLVLKQRCLLTLLSKLRKYENKNYLN